MIDSYRKTPKDYINELGNILINSVISDLDIAPNPETAVVKELRQFLSSALNSQNDLIHTVRINCDANLNKWSLIVDNGSGLFTSCLEAIAGWYLLSLPQRDIQMVFTSDTFHRLQG
jgi:hypothetical protein